MVGPSFVALSTPGGNMGIPGGFASILLPQGGDCALLESPPWYRFRIPTLGHCQSWPWSSIGISSWSTVKIPALGQCQNPNPGRVSESPPRSTVRIPTLGQWQNLTLGQLSGWFHFVLKIWCTVRGKVFSKKIKTYEVFYEVFKFLENTFHLTTLHAFNIQCDRLCYKFFYNLHNITDICKTNVIQ